ncbi:MAG: sulfatase [Candidatus Wallbacteria bacterium]|nr:sulfatase [Candidatus Wallbacteria bacterium]
MLLIADSLRPDYLGVFGHPRPTSPNLDRLARESFVFTRASTVIPRTTASWASLMTGCYPAETGIRTTFARRRAPRPPIATLPRLLADAGYHTAVFADGIEHHLADEHWGFRESRVPEGDYKAFVRHLLLLGSPLLMPYALTEWGRVAWPEVNGGFWLTTDPRHQAGQLARCLEEHGSQPVFAVVFFALCHIPYAAPNPEGLRFVAPGYEGPNRFGRFPDMAGEPVPAGAEQQRVKQLYEGAVASVDAAIGCIRSNLVRMGLEDRTLLIVTSDHGEDLFDTGDRFGHGEHLSPVTVHVPLMVRLPGGRPPVGANDSIVRTIDLAPTVLDLLGMPCPAFMSGVSLEPLLRGRTRDLGLAGYSETDLWLSTAGAFSFQVERVPYPNFQVLCTPDASEGDRMRLNAEYARIVDFAKYRRIWNRRGALEYRPTVAEPHWYREGNPEGLETELDRLMLGRFGFTRGKRGFYLPPED